MLRDEWKLAHSVLSSSMNLGLLHPSEVGKRPRPRTGRAAPINSVEGFMRQVIGWREYVWGVYWLWMPEYREAQRPRGPPRAAARVHRGGSTDMACVGRHRSPRCTSTDSCTTSSG